MVQDACWLCAYVRGEMRTYMCYIGSGVAAVTIAVDRETADASRGLKWLRETVTYTCVPYVYNWSQDVEKCTLDLVLSSSTRTNTVQATAMASKERRKSLRHPLVLLFFGWELGDFSGTRANA